VQTLLLYCQDVLAVATAEMMRVSSVAAASHPASTASTPTAAERASSKSTTVNSPSSSRARDAPLPPEAASFIPFADKLVGALFDYVLHPLLLFTLAAGAVGAQPILSSHGAAALLSPTLSAAAGARPLPHVLSPHSRSLPPPVHARAPSARDLGVRGSTLNGATQLQQPLPANALSAVVLDPGLALIALGHVLRVVAYRPLVDALVIQVGWLRSLTELIFVCGPS
jgi:hypothetical protein